MVVAVMSIVCGILFMVGPPLLAFFAKIHLQHAGILTAVGVILIGNGVRLIRQARTRSGVARD